MKTVLAKAALAKITMVGGALLLAACTANTDPEATEATKSEALTILPPGGPITRLNCITAAANVNASLAKTGYWENADIAAPYGSISCIDSYIVQATGGGIYGVYGTVGPAATVSESACPNTKISATFLGAKDGGSWVTIGETSISGTWVKGYGLVVTGCYFGSAADGSPGTLSMGTTSSYETYRLIGSVEQHPANEPDENQLIAMSMTVADVPAPPK